MNRNRRTFCLVTAGSLASAGAAPWVFSGCTPRTAAPAVAMPGTGTRAQWQARHFPNVEFRTQHDRRVRFYDDLIKGRKVLINFMYTDCTNTCPLTTRNLVKVQEAFGDRMGRDVFFISMSLTPDHDTPERLREYAEQQGCGDGWYFLTGRIEDIDRVRRSLGVYDDPDIANHTGILTFGNELAGRWGATNTLGTADHIVWTVKSKLDGWAAEPWPLYSWKQEG
jgi:protein SCO1/2